MDEDRESKRKIDGVQWMMDKHVVIKEDKINSHGGSQSAGSQSVSGCSHSGIEYPQGSWREKNKGGSQEM